MNENKNYPAAKNKKTGKKRLYRSKEDCIIAGVCGGIAEYLDIDPSIVRIIASILILNFGTGIIIYIICAFCIPEKD